MAFLTQEQLDALAQFDTPTICNAIEGFGVRGRTEGFTRPELRMRAAMSDKPMVGYARTGVISARQPATPAHSAVMEAYYRLRPAHGGSHSRPGPGAGGLLLG